MKTTISPQAASVRPIETKLDDSVGRLITPFDHLRAIAGQLYHNGSKTDSDAILNAVQNAEAEHAALVALHNTIKEMVGEGIIDSYLIEQRLKAVAAVRQ